MNHTFEQPLDDPAVLPRQHGRLPRFLHLVVDDGAFPTVNGLDGALERERQDKYFAQRAFSWSDITKQRVEIHVRCKTRDAEGSSFVSAHEREDAASKHLRFSSSPKRQGHTGRFVKLVVDTSGLVPAWAITIAGAQVPIWIEQGALPKVPKGVLHMTPEAFDAFDASAWMCLDEVRAVLGLREGDGGQGEWLACGYIPRGRVCGQVVLGGVQGKDKKQLDDEGEESRDPRRNITRKERNTEDELHHRGGPPPIPVRTSSLRSYPSADRSERQHNNTHDARSRPQGILNPKDERTVKRAQSLLRQALILSAEEVEVRETFTSVDSLTDKVHQVERQLQELKPAKRRLKYQHQNPATQLVLVQETEAELDPNYDRGDQHGVVEEVQSSCSLPRHEKSKRLTFQKHKDNLISNRLSHREGFENPQSNVESGIEGFTRTRLSHDIREPQGLVAVHRSSRQLHSKALQDSQSGLEPVPAKRPLRITPSPHPAKHTPNSPTTYTPSTTPPASSHRSKGHELRARLAELKEHHGPWHPRREYTDYSGYYIPEEVCSESVLNEVLDLPMPTPAASVTDSEADSGW